MIEKLNKKITNKNNNKTNNTQTQQNNQKWVTFEHHNPIIRKITNIFRNTNLNITYRVSNTAQNLLKPHKRDNDTYANSGIYSIKCNTCNKRYIGQTGRSLKTRFVEHCRYRKTNGPKSAYALHILNNSHEYGPIQNTMELLKICKKAWRMNAIENVYIQIYHQQSLLIKEQIPGEETLYLGLSPPPATFKTHAPTSTQLPKYTNHKTASQYTPHHWTL
jgi:hypothetical protein